MDRQLWGLSETGQQFGEFLSPLAPARSPKKEKKNFEKKDRPSKK
jgi:hypothetical protein